VRVIVADIQVPFIHGGAEALADSLVEALRARGHEAELVTMPFRFGSTREIRRSMETWATESFERLNGHEADLVVCLRFPSYSVSHSNKVAWLVHQHRAVYDLWETEWDGGLSADPDGLALRQQIAVFDEGALEGCQAIYTISNRVSRRLLEFNGVESTVLHPPSKLSARLAREEPEPFVFFPSRLELLKRQHLLVEAMQYVRSPVFALIAGEGGSRAALERLIGECGVSDRVRLLGWVDDEALCAYYARCLGVVFTPFDEDYGLVVAEAMASSKPVVTCRDSGEPVEFVQDGETGFVVDPDPRSIAMAIDRLAEESGCAERLGRSGHARLAEFQISWNRVVDTLLHCSGDERR